MVELYVNNVLVDFKKADAAGFYTFDVPLVYGNSIVKLRFFGPYGEERIKEQNIVIPFNFLPVNQFEYTASAGLVGDGETSKYSRLAAAYGLTRSVTVGGGVEYLSSVNSGKPMPFVNASIRLSSSLMVTAEHALGIRSKGILSYRLPSNIQLEVNYAKYTRGQDAVRFSYLEEKKVAVSVPFQGKKFTAFSRMSFGEYNSFKFKNQIAELMVSSVFAGISSNLTTFAQFTNYRNPFVYSSLSMNFRLPFSVRLTPLAQYDYSLKGWRMLRAELEKTIFHRSYVNLAYEKNRAYNSSGFTLGFRYNFSFAQTAFSIRQTRATTSVYQLARGSLIYNEHTNRITASDQVSIGKAGLIIAPFLDINCNGKRELTEPAAPALKLRINGGFTKTKPDGTILISGLEGHTDYLIDLDKDSFENIAWQMRNKLIKVTAEPNHIKLIEVPVAVVGEVSGTVYLNSADGDGIGGINVNIYNSRSQLVTQVLTEPDGFFSYLGLVPGSYTATIDGEQLSKLQFKESAVISFVIKPMLEGDIADGLKFELSSTKVK
jgi:hypothetical protein